ncbi:O-methyltransferase [Mycena epipterygia]|nr:O-methyltransferase [Mycena epipterygia]
MESLSTLRLLANIILDGVDTMERIYLESGTPLPSLAHPFDPEDPAEALRKNPEVNVAIKNIVAAAGQITAVVSDPVRLVINSALAFHVSCCLRAASEINVVEILREAGPQGVHVKEIAAPSKTSPPLIARILRLLATHHIFREVSPGVFANNRISSTLDKGKPSSVLFGNRADRLVGTPGTAALAEYSADMVLKASTFLVDTLLDPAAHKLPYNLAFATDDPVFVEMQRPENDYDRKRFAAALRGTPDPLETSLQGFDWDSLPKGAVVVDVGGGIGHVSLAITLKHPKLHIVNQDLGPTIELSKAHWREHFPAHVDNGLAEFQVHNFFQPQLVKNAAVFLLRHIIHDYSDPQAISILQRLREAATQTTKLVVLDKIVPSVSADDLTQDIPGAARPSAPQPLLPNWGVASAEMYTYDLTMHNMIGGVERTIDEFTAMLAPSGWKLVQVHHCPPSLVSHLVAMPM